MTKPINQIILVIDDTPENLTLMNALLKDLYKVKVANNAERGLAIARSDKPPDLILLDIMMPGMDGYQACQQLKADTKTQDIPIIFLTAKAEVEDERRGLELGAVDYITKPISPAIVLARVKTHLLLKSAADFLRNQNDFLEQEVQKRTAELAAIQDVTIQVLTSLAETRDADTGNHIRRTQFYIKALAEALQTHPRFSTLLTDGFIHNIYKSAPLHDIGKIGIADSILLKPGRLDDAESDAMKKHALLGYQVIDRAEKQLGMTVEFLQIAKNIALSHHERWDGTGYPQGLSGEQIPVAARLMAIADVYDALTSRRIYKDSMSHDSALTLMNEGRGTQFDPDILDTFLNIHQHIHSIALKYADT